MRERPGSVFFYKPRELNPVLPALTCQPYQMKFELEKEDFIAFEIYPKDRTPKTETDFGLRKLK